MWATLNTLRPNLSVHKNWVNAGIIGTASGCLSPQLMSDIFYTGNLCINTSIQFNTIASPSNSATSWSWSFPGSTVTSSTSSTPTLQYTTPGTYTVSLTTQNGSNTTTSSIQVYISSCTPIQSTQGNWYFGTHAGLNFSSGTPVAVNSACNTIDTDEGSATQSDQNGNLLFYTDGITVWDKNHQVMQPITHILTGHTSTSQSALIVPDPGNNLKYYIFTHPPGNITTPNATDYTIVDFTSNSNGVLININTPLPMPSGITRTGEGIIAIPHCNGRDYWIVSHSNESNDNNFIVWLLSSSGISQPQTYNIANTENYYDMLKASPDNSKIAYYSSLQLSVLMLAFNNSTGVINSPSSTIISRIPRGMSFSPNSNVFYVFDGNANPNIYQYNLNAANIPGSEKLVYQAATIIYSGQMQLTPENPPKIIADIGYSNSLFVINSPDALNTSNLSNQCGFTTSGPSLLASGCSGIHSRFGLPNMIDGVKPVFQNPDFTITYPNCSTVVCNVNNCFAQYNASWNFGDGASGTGQSVTHTYASSNTFHISLTLSLGSFSFPVITNDAGIIFSTPSISGTNPVCQNVVPTSIYSTQSIAGATYLWTVTNGTISGANNQNTANVLWQTGTGTLSVTVTRGTCAFSNTINITVYPNPTANAGADLSGCVTQTLGGSPVASAGTSPYTYQWSPSTFLSSATVANPQLTGSTMPNGINYTVTVTDAHGCLAADAVFVNGMNGPLSTITASNNNFCVGGSTTLMASAGTSYLWSTGATSQSITVSPTSNTTYSVSVSNGVCTSNASVNIGVKPLPNIIISANSVVICSGNSATITATGNSVAYSWNTTPVQTSSSITVAPSVTTNYSVTGIGANSCVKTVSQLITVNPIPVITATASPSPVCANTGTVTLTAGSGTTISCVWKLGATTVATGTTANITPTAPNNSTIYTLIATGANGCTATTQTNPVNVQNCNCTIAGGTNFPNYNINATVTYNNLVGALKMVNQDVKINSGTTTINNGVLYAAQNVKIVVNSGARLVLNNVHILSCANMWDGIVVKPGGTILLNGCLIEDALKAVDLNSPTYTSGNPVIDCHNTCFNRNYIGIEIGTYSSTLASYPFLIYNTVFTCRNFSSSIYPALWPQNSSLKALNTAPSNLASPYTNFSNYPPVNLKAPYTTEKSLKGVHILSVGQTVSSGTVNTYYGIEIGSTVPTPKAQNFNIFDNHVFGIYASTSNFISTNNVFQNIANAPSAATPGVGIYGAVKSPQRYANITKTGNYTNVFYDCVSAIELNNYYACDIKEADIKSTHIFNNSFDPKLSGYYGINIHTPRFDDVNISKNNITNITNGIVFFADVVGTASTQIGKLKINENLIQNQTQGNTLNGQYVLKAITVDNVINGTSNVINNAVIKVINNNIIGAFNGINVFNYQNPDITIGQNYITIVAQANSHGQAVRQYGIDMRNCAFKNALTTIYDNNAIGPAYTKVNSVGISTSINRAPDVSCNQVQDFEKGFEFSGTQIYQSINLRWRNNLMYTCAQGMVLGINGWIGQQGTTAAAMDNQWAGTWTPTINYKTFTYTTSGLVAQSKLYVRNAAAFNPSGASSVNGTTGFPTLDNYTASTIIPGAAANTNVCASLPQGPCPQCPSPNRIAQRKLIRDSLDLSLDTLLVRRSSKLQLFKDYEADPSAIAGDQVIQNFYNASLAGNRNRLVKAERKLNNRNYTGAQNQLAAIQNPDAVETVYMNLQLMYLAYMQDSIVPDSTALSYITGLCPFEYGEVVYQAQSFYNLVNNVNISFDDNCTVPSASRLMQSSGFKDELKESILADKIDYVNLFDFELYPNPNNTEKLNVKLNYVYESLNIEITNIVGAKILNKKFNKTESGLIEIELHNFANGTYFVTVKDATGHQLTKRLIVTR